MIKYSVRSRQLIDLVGDIKRDNIILSPYFQRNLVWRLIHKQDFIKTILLGYPFPQIFLAKGGINAEKLTSISLIVDGQQRMNSIVEFIDNEFEVEGKTFNKLLPEERDNFLTYEIAIIELQMESDDPNIKEVFKRLNRIFYSLTNIEKLATEYAPSEIMLVAKLLTNELDIKTPRESHDIDPNVPDSFIVWASKKKIRYFSTLIEDSGIFTQHEIARLIPLMTVLNILASIESGIINRNVSTELLEQYKESYPSKDKVVSSLEKVAKLYLDLGFPQKSYWFNKANFFSLVFFFYEYYDNLLGYYSIPEIKKSLLKFESSLPEDYSLAAKEGVNNKKERLIRHNYLYSIFFE